MQFIVQSLTLVLPIFLSGIAFIAIIKNNLFARLDTPLDFGAQLSGRRIFGDNKTWRGVAVYIIISIVVCAVLDAVNSDTSQFVHPVFYQNPLYVGIFFAGFYVAGELLNSFIKRQLAIAPGASSGTFWQKVIDNVDGMITTALALLLVMGVSIGYILTALVAGFVLHELTDYAMRRLRLK